MGRGSLQACGSSGFSSPYSGALGSFPSASPPTARPRGLGSKRHFGFATWDAQAGAVGIPFGAPTAAKAAVGYLRGPTPS